MALSCSLGPLAAPPVQPPAPAPDGACSIDASTALAPSPSLSFPSPWFFRHRPGTPGDQLFSPLRKDARAAVRVLDAVRGRADVHALLAADAAQLVLRTQRQRQRQWRQSAPAQRLNWPRVHRRGGGGLPCPRRPSATTNREQTRARLPDFWRLPLASRRCRHSSPPDPRSQPGSEPASQLQPSGNPEPLHPGPRSAGRPPTHHKEGTILVHARGLAHLVPHHPLGEHLTCNEAKKRILQLSPDKIPSFLTTSARPAAAALWRWHVLRCPSRPTLRRPPGRPFLPN